jgi:hypothetical protein
VDQELQDELCAGTAWVTTLAVYKVWNVGQELQDELCAGTAWVTTLAVYKIWNVGQELQDELCAGTVQDALCTLNPTAWATTLAAYNTSSLSFLNPINISWCFTHHSILQLSCKCPSA